MRKFTISALTLNLFFSSFDALAFETEMLQSAGPTDKRINIIIVGDGYRAEDQTLLTQRAQNMMVELWTHPAFGEYRQFFNVKAIHTISADDGAVNGDNPPTQATIFQSYFNCGGTDRLLCVGDTAKLSQVLATDAPEYDSRFDIVLVSVNDSKYGGAGGSYATASAHVSAPEIAVHEIGHSFGGLADEYDYGGSGPSTSEFVEPNVTIQTVRANIKWNVWISAATPIPTPEGAGYSNAVGLFEGAKYYPTGHYRPWDDCEMKVLGVAFCPVCTEALIWAVYDKADPIETRIPNTSSVKVPANGSQAFSFKGPQPELSTLSASWALDGVNVGSGTTYTVSGMSLGSTQHVLTLTVRDQTVRVRRDPNAVLSSTYSWAISAEGNQGNGGAGGGGAGGAGTGGAGTGGKSGTGGRSGTGGAGTGGKSGTGGAGTGGKSGTGGTGTGGRSAVEPCVPSKTISGGQSGNFETSAAYCFRTADTIQGWGCSNFSGRSLLINDVVQASCGTLPLPPKINGYYYFEASAGAFPWASVYWW